MSQKREIRVGDWLQPSGGDRQVRAIRFASNGERQFGFTTDPVAWYRAADVELCEASAQDSEHNWIYGDAQWEWITGTPGTVEDRSAQRIQELEAELSHKNHVLKARTNTIQYLMESLARRNTQLDEVKTENAKLHGKLTGEGIKQADYLGNLDKLDRIRNILDEDDK